VKTTTWDEYDRLLERFDRGEIDDEPEAPEAVPNYPKQGGKTAGQSIRRSQILATGLGGCLDAIRDGTTISDRTERRRRQARREAVDALLEDARVTTESAVRRVRARRTPDGWLRFVKCARCGELFTAKRSDARYCGPNCRQAARRKEKTA
jgi:hypothetical protein